MRLCFQSERIGLTAREHLSVFDVADLPDTEYPNGRLYHLIDHLPQGYLYSCVKDFIDSYDNDEARELLIAAIEDRGDHRALFVMENNKYAEDLGTFVYGKLDAFFEEINSRSFLTTSQLEYFGSLLPLLDNIFPFNKARNPLVLNKEPYDYDRGILQNFENETWLFYNRPLPCVVLFPDEVTDEEYEVLYDSVGSPPHIFITARDSVLYQSNTILSGRNIKRDLMLLAERLLRYALQTLQITKEQSYIYCSVHQESLSLF